MHERKHHYNHFAGRRAVFTRWGSRSCPKTSRKLYDGFIGGGAHNHNGSGANNICMHPQPQNPAGASTGNQNGALLYGVEYENTGAVDKNHDKDAGCVVCQQRSGAGVSPYVQWGRKSCTNGHKTEYYGLIMASHYSHKKSEFICVDWERAFHSTSSNSNHNGGLLYTTEVEQGSADKAYGHDIEVSCAVCSSSTEVICGKILNCATTVTCTTKTNHQCSKCEAGYYLANAGADNCIPCPPGKYCDGTTKIQDNSGGWDIVFD